MTQSQQSLYYAAIFLPVVIKPAYALLSDGLPIFGYRRRPYFVLSSLGMAAAYLVTGTLVRTAGGALLVGLLRVLCSSCAELMLGATLVELAGADGIKNAGTLQSRAVAGRYAGSFVAALAGMLIYSCHDPSLHAAAAGARTAGAAVGGLAGPAPAGGATAHLADRTVIALAAIFPAAATLASFVCLPESPRAARGGEERWGQERGLAPLLLLLALQRWRRRLLLLLLLPLRLLHLLPLPLPERPP